jgi:hypothetical protein
MTDPLTKIDKMARASRLDGPPPVDVSDRVLASIRKRETAYGYGSLQWIAVGSTVAATAMAISIVWLYQTWSEPFNTVFLDLFWGLL